MSLPKIQLESKEDVRFLSNQLKSASSTSLETRSAEIIYKKNATSTMNNMMKQQQVKSTRKTVNVLLEKVCQPMTFFVKAIPCGGGIDA